MDDNSIQIIRYIKNNCLLDMNDLRDSSHLLTALAHFVSGIDLCLRKGFI